MTYEEWIEAYRPVKNHIDTNASFDGIMFETFGPELDYVRAQPNSKVWTYVSGDGDAIIDGFHYVNRMGYFICDVSCPLDVGIEIDLEDDSSGIVCMSCGDITDDHFSPDGKNCPECHDRQSYE